MDSVHAAAYVGYDDALSPDHEKRRRALRAFEMWKARVPGGVPCGHRGRRPVYLAEDLDAALGAAHLRGGRHQLRKVVG